MIRVAQYFILLESQFLEREKVILNSNMFGRAVLVWRAKVG